MYSESFVYFFIILLCIVGNYLTGAAYFFVNETLQR